MARKSERNKLYEELDAMKTAREGFISYKEFKLLVQEAEGLPKDSEWVLFFMLLLLRFFRKSKLVTYFEAMEHGKKMVKWPPPMFIPTISLVQIVFFFSADQHVHRLQFDT